MTMRWFLVFALLLLPASAGAQGPYAGWQSRSIKALSDEQVADLRAGRGIGLALTAELNGYPGPTHVLELAERLQLTDVQRARVGELYAAMRAEALPLGERLIAQERALEHLFAARTATPENLSAATHAIGVTSGALRAAHLKYHLFTLEALTGPQARLYAELRGYGSGQTPAHHHRRQH
jgi:hypothetical protein